MFKRWFSKKGKAIMSDTSSTISITNSNGNTPTGIGTASCLPTYAMNTMNTGAGMSGYAPSSGYTVTPYISSNNFTIGTNLHNSTSVVVFYNPNNSEIVRLNKDGTITWGNGINVDEAAEAFGRAISLGAEMQAGITEGSKRRMRDSVFADIIEIAKEKGFLTADDLTYLLEASKIVEKLKGGKE